MLTAAEKKKAYAEWRELCKRVQQLTPVTLSISRETPLEKEKRIRRLQSNYAAFCEYYFPQIGRAHV